MTTLIASFVIMLMVVGGMAVGVLLGREPIKGSCGGLNNAGVEGTCELCGGSPAKCEEVSK
ncbi:(Na+)-NQR maturation NqrM [Pseudohongiella sp.]|uniref:ApbE family protein n=1 Tax=marine sediment metagenome TaxID=412755 RepID=A0A0F9W5Y2_9ZZZZ|nr:(Na+)-NQR maturation NqrM [Pseudohongiella sp.]HDZ09065.1 (Na+)-NQR maturation NqrM [Pseudohongiella sp.]HEA63599.1 (Na+)-NQR maturation NqrM [Pseudohongiella sp.]